MLIAGRSPRIQPSATYDEFFLLVASQIASAIVHATAYAEERRRVEALAAGQRARLELMHRNAMRLLKLVTDRCMNI